jgi:hypothetical protein
MLYMRISARKWGVPVKDPWFGFKLRLGFIGFEGGARVEFPLVEALRSPQCGLIHDLVGNTVGRGY